MNRTCRISLPSCPLVELGLLGRRKKAGLGGPARNNVIWARCQAQSLCRMLDLDLGTCGLMMAFSEHVQSATAKKHPPPDLSVSVSCFSSFKFSSPVCSLDFFFFNIVKIHQHFNVNFFWNTLFCMPFWLFCKQFPPYRILFFNSVFTKHFPLFF